jgi:hypothetical protein
MPLQNFVDQAGPTVSAAWLNLVDALDTTVFNNTTTKPAARAALTQDLPLEIANGGTGVRSLSALQNMLSLNIPQTPEEAAQNIIPLATNYLPGDIRRYGAVSDPTLSNASIATANTTAINNALLCNGLVTIPAYGIYTFTQIVCASRQVILQGQGPRSVLYQTASTTPAISLNDSSTTVYPGGTQLYDTTGQFTFSDFTLFFAGGKGFELGQTCSSNTVLERISIWPTAFYSTTTSGNSVLNTTGISCDSYNASGSIACYNITLRQLQIGGCQTGILINNGCNVFHVENIYSLDCIYGLVLAADTNATAAIQGITMQGVYFQNQSTHGGQYTNSSYATTGNSPYAIAGCRGVVFGAGGCAQTLILNSSFECASTQASPYYQPYAWDFSQSPYTNGTSSVEVWDEVAILNAYYLLTNSGGGDGAFPTASTSKRYAGVIPQNLIETGVYFDGNNSIAFRFVNGVCTQEVAPLRIGGNNVGGISGRLSLGSSQSDSYDGSIHNDSTGELNLDYYAGLSFNKAISATVSTVTISGQTVTVTFTGVTPSTYAVAGSSVYLTGLIGTFSGTGTSASCLNGTWSLTAVTSTTVSYVCPGIPNVSGMSLTVTTLPSALLYERSWQITATGDVTGPAGSTTMTAGFPRMPMGAGPPTGTPATIAGTAPFYYDSTDKKLYIYDSGTGWHYSAAFT